MPSTTRLIQTPEPGGPRRISWRVRVQTWIRFSRLRCWTSTCRACRPLRQSRSASGSRRGSRLTSHHRDSPSRPRDCCYAPPHPAGWGPCHITQSLGGEIMRRRLLRAIMAVPLLLVTLVVVGDRADASTQIVGFRVGSWHCPKAFGLRSLNGVHVSAWDSRAPYINGEWVGSTTGTAYVRINAVPPGGGPAWVTLSYSCWGSTPTPAEGLRWIYGSGSQPTYTL